MKTHMDYKVPEGKLLKINLERDGEIIKDIRIRRDFFIHPENSITEIEDILKGTAIKDIGKQLSGLFELKKIHVIGFGIKDLENAILSMSK